MENMVNNLNIFSGVYKGKKILVTGHTGFKGSWLTLWLMELGAKVAGFSSYLPTEPCNFETLKLDKKIEHYVADVRDLDKLRDCFEKVKPEIVFHLAAQPLVRRSYDDPKLTFDTNLGGTVNVLECVRSTSSVKSAVIITSDKCYENVSWEWGYRENDRLGGEDPYSASKACAEIATKAYIASYFNREGIAQVATTRAGNVIGGGDWAEDRIVPDCVRAWSQGKQAIIRNPEATRPWQHVLEPISGYLLLGARLLQVPSGIAGEAFNFGPDSEIVESVGKLGDKLSSSWGGVSWQHVPINDSDKKEATLLKLCCDKAFRRLAWRQALSLDETVDFTAKWYRNYYDGQDMYKFSCGQIIEYIEKARQQKIGWAL